MWTTQEKKHRAKRILSAPKKTSQQQTNKTRIKTQITNYPPSQLLLKNNRIKTSHYDSQFNKITCPKAGKDRQQLFEQNLQLRKKLNDLQNQISIGRSKVELERKKNINFTKKLQREFQKQLYWTGSNKHNHLISGIKTQYEKLKQQYEKKCEQIRTLKKNVQFTTQNQYKIYTQALQDHINQLTAQIKKIQQNSSLNINEYKNVNLQYVAAQAYKQNEKLQKINSKLNEKVTDLQQRLKQQNKKIQFIQKLLIQRDNNQYKAHKKANKSQKDKKILQIKITKLQEQIKQNVKNYKHQLDRINNTLNKRYLAQQTLFQRQLEDKNMRIAKLQKEISYLSTLLSYWKPLDQWKKQQIDQNDQQDQSDVSSEIQAKIKKQTQLAIEPSILPRERTKTINSPSLRPLNTDQSKKSRQARKPRTSGQKNSQNSKKMRKVEFREVEAYSLVLRYRLIGQQISKQQINDFLKSPNNDSWSKEYITMAEVKSILQEKPFCLKQPAAYLISRYIVEDSQEEYVYCDDINQISRPVAKSILKALIGQYKLPNLTETKAELKQFLIKYEKNLKAALSTIAPLGHIPGSKLIQLLYSLGMELSEGCQMMILGNMMMISQQEQKMNYKAIFE